MSFETADAESAFPIYDGYKDASELGDTGTPGIDPDVPADTDLAANAIGPPDDWGEETADQPFATSGSGIDNRPPTDVPPEASDYESEPGRGEALARLFDYAEVSGSQIHDEIVDRVTAISADVPEVQETLDHLTSNGITLDDAIEHVAFADGAEDSLNRVTVEHELEMAHLQYGDDLQQAGVAFQEDLDGLTLKVVDAEAYAHALDSMPIPVDEEGRTRFNNQSTSVTHEAMGDAAHAILHPQTANDTNVKLAAELPAQGEKLAIALRRLNAPEAIIEAAESMATAHREGMHKEWAEGFSMWLIGNSDTPMGTDRLVTQEEWGKANEYLGRLVQNAPHAQFTRDTLETVMRDAYRATHQAPELPQADRTEAGVMTRANEFAAELRRVTAEAALPLVEAYTQRLVETIWALGQQPNVHQPAGHASYESDEPADSDFPSDGTGREEHKPEDGNPTVEGGNNIDKGPPIDTPSNKAGFEPEPERGEALKRVFDYAAVADNIVSQQMADRGVARTTEEENDRAFQEMISQGMTEDEAFRAIARRARVDSDTRHNIIVEELAVANLQYGADLEQAGLKLVEGLETIEVDVTDLDKFIAALRNRPEITDEAVKAHFDYQTLLTVKGAMCSTAYSIVHEGHGHEHEQSGSVAQQLPEHAEDLAQVLRSIAAPQALVEAAKIMATAQREGMLPEWAEGFDLMAIGYADIPIGTDRYDTPESWDQLQDYLYRLARDAPDAQFTWDAHAAVIRDATHVIMEQSQYPAGQIDANTPQDSPEYAAAMRRTVLGMVIPMIKENLEIILPQAAELMRRRRNTQKEQ